MTAGQSHEETEQQEPPEGQKHALSWSGDHRAETAVAGGLPRPGDHQPSAAQPARAARRRPAHRRQHGPAGGGAVAGRAARAPGQGAAGRRLPGPGPAGRRCHRQHAHRLPARAGRGPGRRRRRPAQRVGQRPARPGRRPCGGAGPRRGRPGAVGGGRGRGRRRGAGRPGGGAARGTGLDLPVAGAGPRAGPGPAGPPRRGGRDAGRAGRRPPRDEEVLVELLRAEAATVGPSAALDRYEAYRRSLCDELGTDPGPALQAVYQQLLQGTAPLVRHGVPHEPNPLLGRDDDIAAVAGLLRSSRVTSIVGPGGLGKTRLAQVVSRQAEQRIVHFVALAGVASDDDVVGEVASALGAGESRRTPMGQRAAPTGLLAGIAVALGPGPALLVLDNCEQVLRGAAQLVGALMSMTQDLRVLTTSRAPLGLSSESVYLMPELPLATAVELFTQRARAARPGADLPAEQVEEVCRHLDGLPLAVELAAARVRVMSVAEIARRLEDRFALLRGGPRDAPQRHQTLEAVVDWSWNLLEEDGRAAMRALSVFPAGFAAEAARQVLDDGAGDADAGTTAEDVPPVLGHLVDQSLLQVADTPTGARFRMLETVRELSTARREAAGETDQVVGRFLAWARGFGVAANDALYGTDPYGPLERFRAEQDNLAQALRYGLARADAGTVAATAAVLGGLWMVESNYPRVMALAAETAHLLSHFRPGPDLVEVTRTTLVLCTAYTFLLEGPRPLRSLVALRRLPPAPPDTLVRAVAVVLGTASEDRAALDELCDSDEPLVAGAASSVVSYYRENEGDLDAP